MLSFPTPIWNIPTFSKCNVVVIFSFFKKDFKAIEKEFGGGKQQKEQDKESLTKENKDGTISNRKEMGMSGGKKSSKRLVFIAKLDN